MKVAIYARVSTTDQNCELQLTDLTQHARRMEWELVDQYVEKASTRKKRPELERLLDDAKHRRFDILLVWKLDRFGRTVRELDENIGKLDRAGVRFIALHSGIDTDHRSPTSRLLFNILSSFAEFERDLIQERTFAGVAQARREGRHPGRPAKVFDRAKAAELRTKGHSWRSIARKLKIDQSVIRRSLAKTA